MDFKKKEAGIILNIKVIPRAAKDAIAGQQNNALKIRIKAPPVDGKANTYLIKFLSKYWHIPRRNIEILTGESTRNKRLKIIDPPDTLIQALTALD